MALSYQWNELASYCARTCRPSGHEQKSYMAQFVSALGRTFPFRGDGGKVWNRRLSPVAVPPGEGRLTEQTAGVQPAQSEQVFMPHSGPCPRRRVLSITIISGIKLDAQSFRFC
jgi:hypothetical protein